MYDFESLAGELLQARPELKREELMRRIEHKKQTVGAGYLTDQGALFLVAGELGVSLRREEASADMTIKDLYIGANDVTVVARVLAMYPEATYSKKDGGKGKYRRLVLFDGNQTVRLTAWEEKADEVERAGLEVGSPVRIVSGYVKQGLDGKPNLNLGKRGKIEVVSDQKIEAKLPLLSSATERPTKVSQERQLVALESVVATEPRFSEFTRSDGSSGSLFQFGVSGEGGRGEMRVVIWSPANRPDIKKGQKVVITNVKAKRSTGGTFEIHGDAGSTIMMGSKTESVEMRVAAFSPGATRILLGLRRNGRVEPVVIGNEVKEPQPGEVVKVTPDSESDQKFYCRTPGSLEIADSSGFPGLEELSTKLRDARTEDAQIMVEVIALSQGSVDDVRLKDGSMVKKGELVVGDDTDEIKLVAWRDLSGRVSGVQPGERLRIVGALVKSTRLGAWLLHVTNVTAIEKLRGRP
jgi:replication factor A1